MARLKTHNIAIIGHGYWGSKVSDRIQRNKRFKLKYVVDDNPIDLDDTSLLTDIDTVLSDKSIELVGVFTPPNTHCELLTKVINAKKHAYTTKPFVLNHMDACKVIELASKKRVRVFVDYTYLFSPVVQKVKEQLDFTPAYIEFANANRWTGMNKPGVSPIEDLMPHIISILLYLLNNQPIEIKNVSRVDVGHKSAMNYIELRSGFTKIFITLGWAYPWKERRNIIVGQDKMITFDTSAIVKVQDIAYDNVAVKTISSREFTVGGEPLQREIDELADALEGSIFASEGDDGHLPIRITELTERINNCL